MFKSWRVGNWGWVRLRNGKPARATYGSNAPYPIAVEFLKDDVIKCNFVNEDGFHIGRERLHDLDAIEHLEGWWGFGDADGPSRPSNQFKTGDWVRVVKSTVHTEKEHPIGSTRQIRTIFDDTKLAFVNHEERFTYILDFDMVEPHQWKVGDWFVVDKKHLNHPDCNWTSEMDFFIGKPQEVTDVKKGGNLLGVSWYWHPSWCRPFEPPKADTKDEADFWPFPDYKVGDYVIMPTKPSDPFLQGHSWSSDLDSIIGIPLLVRRVFPAKLEIDLTHGCILVCKSWVQPCDMGSVEYVTNWRWATHG